MTADTTTTIQISTHNRDALLRLGQIMRERHPEIWGSTPSLNATVGYALSIASGRVAQTEIQLWAEEDEEEPRWPNP